MIDFTSTWLEWDQKKKEAVVRQTEKAPGIYVFEVVVRLQSADKERKPAEGAVLMESGGGQDRMKPSPCIGCKTLITLKCY